MERETKTFGFRLPLDVALEVKVAAIRKQISLQDYFLEATRLKLRVDQETARAA